MKNITLPAALFLSIALAGCAGSDTAADSSASDDCFYIRNVNSWDSIDRDHVYIKEGVDNHFLVTLFASCPGLGFAKAIALSNYNGRMCPGDFGSITYQDGRTRRTCRIDNIEAVDSKADAEAIAESRSEAQ